MVSMEKLPPPAGAASPLRVVIGLAPSGAAALPIDLPCLAGAPTEEIFSGLRAAPAGDVALFHRDGLLVGHAREPFSETTIEADAHRLYARVLAACRGGRHLYRMWNYVPRINGHTAALEHYRAFCKGRSLAFEAAFGAGFERQLPAASAVGSDGRTLEVLFAAGDASPRHVENPEQVPAYLYPPQHGPRPPSFSRATVAEAGGARWIFVSGTAAIKGHASVGAGSLRDQIACTMDNLRLISRASGAGENLGAGTGWARHFKIYLRRAEDLPVARAQLEGDLVFPGDRVSWLRSDICRVELAIEIEATLAG
jgi:hypothetical protein